MFRIAIWVSAFVIAAVGIVMGLPAEGDDGLPFLAQTQQAQSVVTHVIESSDGSSATVEYVQQIQHRFR